MKKIIFSFLLLFVSFSSFSQSDDDFIYVTSSKSGDDFYVYMENSNDETKKFWIKINYPTITVKGKNGKNIKKVGGKAVYYVVMNCTDKTYSTSNMVLYDGYGNAKKRPAHLDTYGDRVIPGSVTNGIYRYVCELE